MMLRIRGDDGPMDGGPIDGGAMDGGAASGLDFTIEVDETRDLSLDADRVEAVITVRVRPARAAEAGARLAEVLIMDRSLSMQWHNKIHEARRAACAAIDAVPDGTLLGIVAGHRQAEPVFPEAGGLATADAETRADARRRVRRLLPEGGTRIGRWLLAADEAFAAGPAEGVIRHAVLYTDGINEHETRAELDEALARCAGTFTCDVRGLGEDWNYQEVRHIAEALGGEAAAVLNVADLTADFAALMSRAARLVVPQAWLRLHLTLGFEVAEAARVYPDRADLTAAQRAAGDLTVEIPLGAWAAEPAERRYQVSLRFGPGALPLEQERRAARVYLLAELPDGTLKQQASGAIVVIQHDLSGETILPDSITRTFRERELMYVIRDCVDAWVDRRAADADGHLAEALRRARELADEKLPLLEAVAVVEPNGKVRLRPDVTRGELQRLGLYSAMSSFKQPAGPPRDSGDGQDPGPPPAGRACPECHEPVLDADLFCQACSHPLDREAAP
jgi:Ca-activated chloride channel family protein